MFRAGAARHGTPRAAVLRRWKTSGTMTPGFKKSQATRQVMGHRRSYFRSACVISDASESGAEALAVQALTRHANCFGLFRAAFGARALQRRFGSRNIARLEIPIAYRQSAHAAGEGPPAVHGLQQLRAKQAVEII
jgi:hypothetical protein